MCAIATIDNFAVRRAFLDMIASERGAAANTLQAYGRDIEDFESYLAITKLALADAGPNQS